MFEWIALDPANGIGTTIGFFMFLIIGHYIRIMKEDKSAAISEIESEK